MALVRRPRSARNPITSVGIFVTTIAAVLFLSFYVVDLLGYESNPYVGMLVFLVLPAIFIAGLLLIPVGMARERRKLARGLGPSRWVVSLDLNDTNQRRILGAVGVLTVMNLTIVGVAGLRGLEYMDSPEFCGEVCHTVMRPEYTAYKDGPHARVRCIECHIGPGASWFVKSKIDGIRQVWAVAFDSYDRPIPSPVHDLRPARDTCERCHWPDKFTGDLVRSFPTYGDDETNTASPTLLQLRVGGGGSRFRGPQGIHWHVDADHRVEYIAADDARETIPWVRLTGPDGAVTEFVVEGTEMNALARREIRTMDCVDCHNRPSHRFAASPERAVDRALSDGLLPSNLPFVRREAIAALGQDYPNRDSAERGIEERLRTFYRDNYVELVAANDGRIAQAVDGVKRIYGHSVFPEMNVTWGTHPNHLGHTDSPGCFRCHDDLHVTTDGRAISQDCDTCHAFL